MADSEIRKRIDAVLAHTEAIEKERRTILEDLYDWSNRRALHAVVPEDEFIGHDGDKYAVEGRSDVEVEVLIQDLVGNIDSQKSKLEFMIQKLFAMIEARQATASDNAEKTSPSDAEKRLAAMRAAMMKPRVSVASVVKQTREEPAKKWSKVSQATGGIAAGPEPSPPASPVNRPKPSVVSRSMNTDPQQSDDRPKRMLSSVECQTDFVEPTPTPRFVVQEVVKQVPVEKQPVEQTRPRQVVTDDDEPAPSSVEEPPPTKKKDRELKAISNAAEGLARAAVVALSTSLTREKDTALIDALRQLRSKELERVLQAFALVVRVGTQNGFFSSRAVASEEEIVPNHPLPLPMDGTLPMRNPECAPSPRTSLSSSSQRIQHASSARFSAEFAPHTPRQIPFANKSLATQASPSDHTPSSTLSHLPPTSSFTPRSTTATSHFNANAESVKAKSSHVPPFTPRTSSLTPVTPRNEPVFRVILPPAPANFAIDARRSDRY